MRAIGRSTGDTVPAGSVLVPVGPPGGAAPPPDTGLTNPALRGPYVVDEVVFGVGGVGYAVLPAQIAINGHPQIPAFPNDWAMFDAPPSPGFETRRVDMSGLTALSNFEVWVPDDVAEFFTTPNWAPLSFPFTPANIPLDGVLYIPSGVTPPSGFPVFIFMHGANDPEPYGNSALGYHDVLEIMASWGIIAYVPNLAFTMSVGVSDAVKILLYLEHFKDLVSWNTKPGHPLFGKMDLTRVIVGGQSNGANVCALALYWQRQTSITFEITPGTPVTLPLDGSMGWGPYNFDVDTLFSMGGTNIIIDFMSTPGVRPAEMVNIFCIVGSRDSDGAQGIHGAYPFQLMPGLPGGDPTESSGKWRAFVNVFGGNHNFWNTRWRIEDGGGPEEWVISRAAQLRNLRVFMGAIARIRMGRADYLAMLRDPSRVATDWLSPDASALLSSSTFAPSAAGATLVPTWWSGTGLINHFQDPRRLFIMHNQEGWGSGVGFGGEAQFANQALQTIDNPVVLLGPPQISAPLIGTITSTFGDGSTRYAGRYWRNRASGDGPRPWYFTVATLLLEWTAPGQRFEMVLDQPVLANQLALGQYAHLVFNIAVDSNFTAWHAYLPEVNTFTQDVDFIVEVSAGMSTVPVLASSIHRLAYPDTGHFLAITGTAGAGRSVTRRFRVILAQSLVLPFSRLEANGIHPPDITKIAFVSRPQNPVGRIWVWDVQFMG